MISKIRPLLYQFVAMVTAAIFLLPVVIGLIGTWLPAFGWFPAINERNISVEPWLNLFNYPGFWSALLRSLVTGIGSTAIALLLVIILLTGAYPSKLFIRIEQFLSPVLSVPHAAFAIGIGLLIAPSGWLFRLVESTTGNFSTPATWSLFQDPYGFSLTLTLALKEAPFLLFMSLAVLPSLNISKTLWLSRSMGRSDYFSWFFLIFPQLYKQLKLPLCAVLAYSMTVVDIAIISGPTTPPTLSVLVTNLFSDPNFSNRLIGAAGASFLFFLLLAILLLLNKLERPLALLRNNGLAKSPHRIHSNKSSFYSARVIALLMSTIYIGAAMVNIIWSFAGRWRYPSLLPEELTLRSWSRVSSTIEGPLTWSLLLAFTSALIAIVLVIVSLENETRLKYQDHAINTQRIMLLIYFPLLIPQVAFIFGFHVSLIQLGIDGTFYTLLWSHLIFVVPYVFLTLSGAYRQFDDRYCWQAMSLSGSRFKSFWLIKLPMLARPIMYSFATGFAVSIAQYLPTIFIGAGRYATITTEAVAMSGGGNRRMMAIMALWQQGLPLIVFLTATLIPMFWFRHRRAMNQSASLL